MLCDEVTLQTLQQRIDKLVRQQNGHDETGGSKASLISSSSRGRTKRRCFRSHRPWRRIRGAPFAKVAATFTNRVCGIQGRHTLQSDSKR